MTLKLILTRSLRRGQILAGKALASFTYVVLVVLGLLLGGTIAGLSAWGWHPLRNLDGTVLSAPHALALTFAALGVFAVPLIGVAAFGLMLSTVTRNSAASIVGTLVYALTQEAIGGLVHQTWAKLYLLSDQFDGWHGVFMSPTDWTLIGRAFWVTALYTVVPLAIAFAYFSRRDVAGE
jgi:ABC-2 type transport system permease protein